MIQALIAAVVGALLLAVATVPPIAVINGCCGVLYIGAGAVAAFVWSKLSGGRASLGYGLLSGTLAGLLFTGVVLGGFVAGVAASGRDVAAKLEGNAFFEWLPEGETPRMEEVLDRVEAMIEQSEASEDEKLTRQAQIEKMRADLARTRKDPKASATLDGWVHWGHQLLLGVKKGDLSPLLWPLGALLLCVGLVVTGLSAVGGLIGGLSFGSDAPSPQPGEAPGV